MRNKGKLGLGFHYQPLELTKEASGDILRKALLFGFKLS